MMTQDNNENKQLNATDRLLDQTWPLHGQMTVIKNGVFSRPEPTFRAPAEKIHRGLVFSYQGKLFREGWLWAISDGRYIPYQRVRGHLPRSVRKRRVGGVNWYRAGRVLDTAAKQPLAGIWPYSSERHVADRGQSMTVEAVRPLLPTKVEQRELQRVKQAIARVQQPDSVVIAHLTDTHFSSYASPSTARSLRYLKTVSYYAQDTALDLVVHNGDLTDGVVDKRYELTDMKQAVAALQLSQRPVLISQGNHDDNSGYARDVDSQFYDQVITNPEANQIKGATFAGLLDNRLVTNANHAVYGRYKVPDSPVNVIILDGFDQPDDLPGYRSRYDFRHGWTHFSPAQQTWLRETLSALPDDEMALVFTHIMPHGLPFDRHGNYNEFAAANQRGGADEGDAIRAILRQYQQRTGNLIAVVAGHTHIDDYAYQDGINWIVSACAITDRGLGRLKRRFNSRYEQAWDVFSVNPSTRELYRIRYGYHNRRGFLGRVHWRGFKGKFTF